MAARTRPHRLMFVCTANICRSPMAEALARASADQRGMPVQVRSGGVLGLLGKPAAVNAVRAMREVGLDITGHKSAGITDEDAAWADGFAVMELRHQRVLLDRFPELDGRIVQLGPFGGRAEVPDPVGGWMWRFRRSRALLTRCVDGFLDLLQPGGVALDD